MFDIYFFMLSTKRTLASRVKRLNTEKNYDISRWKSSSWHRNDTKCGKEG